jgi:Fur family ferric uptake transcriptional regulator
MAKPDQRFERYEHRLRASGVRMTGQRRVILRVLAATTDHPDANDIFHRAFAINTSISLSTVYRTMRLLEEHGAIQLRILREHHDHIIDIETSKVIEFRSDKIENLQAEIAAELGYDIVRHRLVLYCKKRSSKSLRQPAPARTKK